MKTDDMPILVRGHEPSSASEHETVAASTMPLMHDQALVLQTTLSNQRFQIGYSNEDLRTLPLDQQVQHFRDGIFDAIAQTIREGTVGQPPMVERLRVATTNVEALEAKGVPFGVGRNSRMNKELRRSLNQEALQSADNRKSRRKPITADSVRQVLRKIKMMRLLGEHFTKMFPYSE